jgi:hypothetical protein
MTSAGCTVPDACSTAPIQNYGSSSNGPTQSHDPGRTRGVRRRASNRGVDDGVHAGRTGCQLLTAPSGGLRLI